MSTLKSAFFAILLLTVMFGLTGCPSDEPGQEFQQDSLVAPMAADKPLIIFNMGAQKCLSARPSSDAFKASDCASGEFNRVLLKEVRPQVYRMATFTGDKCLEVKDGSDESTVMLATCNSSPRQEIKFYDSSLDRMTKKIVFTQGRKCLSQLPNAKSDVASLLLKDCKTSLDQDWLLTPPRSDQARLPKHVWTFWDKGADKMPDFYISNVENWNRILNPDPEHKEWTITVLNLIKDDPNYAGNFLDLDKVPTVEYIKSKIGTDAFEAKLNPYVIMSDFIRLDVLYKNGGVWIDPSVMLHKDLSIIENSINEFDGFVLSGFTSRSQGTHELRYADSFENWFIAALPKTELLKTWKTNFRAYWDVKLPGMSVADNPMYNGSKGVKLDVSQYASLKDYLNQHIALKYTLSQNPKLLDSVFILSDARLREKGPFSLLDSVDWHDSRLLGFDKQGIAEAMKNLDGVLMSKFPSDNSRAIRTVNEAAYFRNPENLFGKLNTMPLPPKKAPTLPVSPTVNKVVWGFWDKGEAALPAFNKYGVEHWRRILEPKGYEVRILNVLPNDDNNALTLLGDRSLLPKNFDRLDEVVRTYKGPDGGEVKMVTSIVQSDCIRLAVLEKFGGVWMDTSNVLIRDLDEMVLDELNASKRSVAGYIMDGYASENSPRVNGERVDGMENWFIAAKAHSPLITAWRKAFSLYWEIRKPGEWISENAMYKDPTFTFGGLGISAPNYLNQHAALKYVLHKTPALGQEILPVKNMNPWWFHSKVGGNSNQLYEGLVSPRVDEYAAEIKREGVGLLKFAGPHLTEIKQNFKTIDAFCRRHNLLTILYGRCP